MTTHTTLAVSGASTFLYGDIFFAPLNFTVSRSPGFRASHPRPVGRVPWHSLPTDWHYCERDDLLFSVYYINDNRVGISYISYDLPRGFFWCRKFSYFHEKWTESSTTKKTPPSPSVAGSSLVGNLYPTTLIPIPHVTGIVHRGGNGIFFFYLEKHKVFSSDLRFSSAVGLTSSSSYEKQGKGPSSTEVVSSSSLFFSHLSIFPSDSSKKMEGRVARRRRRRH